MEFEDITRLTKVDTCVSCGFTSKKSSSSEGIMYCDRRKLWVKKDAVACDEYVRGHRRCGLC